MIFIVMEKNIAAKILKIAKLIYKDKNPIESEKSWFNPYDINIPRPIASLHDDEDFIRALFVQNGDTFDEWGQMDDNKVVVPSLKTYDIVTKFSGSEYVVKKYSNRVEAYNEKDLENRLYHCDPCWDEGDEIDVEYLDNDGDWELDSVEQITEEDINRLVKKILK